jgi:hypothetical protein
MSEATCGIIVAEADPGYRFAHPGYLFRDEGRTDR